MTPDVTAGEYAVGMTYTDRREAMMRHAALIGAFLLMAMTGTGRAEPGFDEKYERDFNIFNPINQYQPTNPLNPINAYDPANPFNPIITRSGESHRPIVCFCFESRPARFFPLTITYDKSLTSFVYSLRNVLQDS